jgi:hypothetical protein
MTDLEFTFCGASWVGLTNPDWGATNGGPCELAVGHDGDHIDGKGRTGPAIRFGPLAGTSEALSAEVERLRAELEDLRAGYQTVCDYAEQVDQLRAQRQAVIDLCKQEQRQFRPAWVPRVLALLGENPDD